MRGMGRIFKRKNSAHWWISYYVRGQEVRESSGSPDRKVAEKLLKQRRKEIGADQLGLRPFVGPAQGRVTVEELLHDLVTDYQVRGRKSLPELQGHLKAVREAFADYRAVDVTASRIRQVVTSVGGIKGLSARPARGAISRASRLGQTSRPTSCPV